MNHETSQSYQVAMPHEDKEILKSGSIVEQRIADDVLSGIVAGEVVAENGYFFHQLDVSERLQKFLSLPLGKKITILSGYGRGILRKGQFDKWHFPIIERGVQIRKEKGAQLIVGKNVRIRKDTKIHIGSDPAKTPTFRIGDNSAIGERSRLFVGDDVTIGTNTHLSWETQITSDNYHQIIYPDGTLSKRSEPIIIGDNTIIFSRSIINPGVTIGDNCAIGSGSVVVKDIPSQTLAAGNPAVVKRKILGIRF